VVSPYFIDTTGELVPVLPETCPLHDKDGRPCRICRNHYRLRKTGPYSSLWVVKCLTHKKCFTLYPPGYTPFGRSPLIPVAADGGKVLDLGNGAERFRGTQFDAALDAAQGKAWRNGNDDPGVSKHTFTTQVNHIQRIAVMLGLEPDISDDQRLAIAQTLPLSTLFLQDGANCFRSNPGYEEAGQAICSILEMLSDTTLSFERLTEAGFQTGLWPEPFFVGSQHRHLRSSAFRHFRTRAPPTTSQDVKLSTE